MTVLSDLAIIVASLLIVAVRVIEGTDWRTGQPKHPQRDFIPMDDQ